MENYPKVVKRLKKVKERQICKTTKNDAEKITKNNKRWITNILVCSSINGFFLSLLLTNFRWRLRDNNNLNVPTN